MRLRFSIVLLAGAVTLRGNIALADGKPEVRVTRGAGEYFVSARFEVDAGTDVTWQVLTDYAGLPRFVPSVRSSTITKRSDGGRVVEQDLEGKAFVFSRDVHVWLDVREQKDQRAIYFRDVLLRDFDVYQGFWRIQPTALGSEVTYALKANPRDSIPDFIARGAFRDNATDMLSRLRAEISHRAALQSPTSSIDMQRKDGSVQ